jgi:hypothetical protein
MASIEPLRREVTAALEAAADPKEGLMITLHPEIHRKRQNSPLPNRRHRLHYLDLADNIRIARQLRPKIHSHL